MIKWGRSWNDPFFRYLLKLITKSQVNYILSTKKEGEDDIIAEEKTDHFRTVPRWFSRVGHPKGIPCFMARYVDNGTTDGYLNLLNLVEHQQAKMPVEAIHVQGLIERGFWFENMILLRCCQKRIEISTKSVITDVAEIVLRTCHILNVESTRLKQCHQLSWWWVCLCIMCHNKTKRPADLSIVKRLGGFSWCKGTAFILNSQTFLNKKNKSSLRNPPFCLKVLPHPFFSLPFSINMNKRLPVWRHINIR